MNSLCHCEVKLRILFQDTFFSFVFFVLSLNCQREQENTQRNFVLINVEKYSFSEITQPLVSRNAAGLPRSIYCRTENKGIPRKGVDISDIGCIMTWYITTRAILPVQCSMEHFAFNQRFRIWSNLSRFAWTICDC